MVVEEVAVLVVLVRRHCHAFSAALVEAKAKLQRCKEGAFKKKATKATDVELIIARSTLCGEREAK